MAATGLLCYTKQGTDHYRLLNDAVHFAVIENDKAVILRNNTGVLFAKAELNDGTLKGCSKTLLYPWLFRFADGSGGVIAVRRNMDNQPDTEHLGSAVIYRTEDFVRFSFCGFLPLEDVEITHPRCMYNAADGDYTVEWQAGCTVKTGKSSDLKGVTGVTEGTVFCECPNTYGIPDAVPGNVLEISEDEAAYIRKMLEVVYNTDVLVDDVSVKAGSKVSADTLPGAVCLYSDGSQHAKRVIWNEEDLASVNTDVPGDYKVRGKVYLKKYPVPFIDHKSDPCVFHINGKYYHTASGRACQLRVSDTVDGLADAKEIVIHKEEKTSFWAQELHVIKGIPYMFTSRCPGDWTHVQSVILKCSGEMENPEDWSEPVNVVRPDGRMLNEEEGICLDMSMFEQDGRYYVIWSNRVMNPDPEKARVNENGVNGPATIDIAEIDPDKPWQLISEPVCISTPDYGWDRIETEVDEGPYILKHGDDLWISFSGASCGVVYCLGLLRAKVGDDLLDPASWDKIPYPLLTRESVPGQYGPGHNNFFKDPEGTGDDWMCLLYRPLAEGYEALYNQFMFNPRHGANRRVHWNANGYPNLEMYPEHDLDPRKADVEITVRVE